MASLPRILGRSVLQIMARRSISQREMCTMKDLDKPVKFSSSEAATWKAAYTRSGGAAEDTLWCEPYIVLGSVASFLFYFCYFREENDIDAMIETPLGHHIEGFEEAQLRTALQFNLDKGLPTADIENRLREIEREKASKSSSQ